MYQLFRDRPITVFCIVAVNIVLSLWCINADPIINNDAVTYLAIAQKLVDGLWNETFAYYSWPFYSILIAATAKLFSISVINAAYVLNTVFAVLLSFAFVAIVKDLSKNNRIVILIAVIVILFFPSINKYRSYIIRDFGYLACYLWSLYFVIRFCATRNKVFLFYWLLCTLLGCLFRVEGIVFLLVVPYFIVLFAVRNSPKRRRIMLPLSVAIFSILVIISFWYLNDKYDALITIANVTGDEVKGLKDLFFANMSQNLNGEELTLFTTLKIFASNLGDVVYQLLRRMSIVYFLLAIYAYAKNLTLKDPLFRRLWIVYIATNILILVSFSFYNHFLVSRYTLATSLTLLLIVPFAIYHLILKAKSTGIPYKAMTCFIGLLLAIEAIDKLNIENKKEYIRSSGEWLSLNTDDDVSLYSNNKLIIYYSNQGADSNLNDLYSYDMLIRNLDFDMLKNYEYVAYATISSFKLDTIAEQRLSDEYGNLIEKIDGYGQQTVSIYRRK